MAEQFYDDLAGVYHFIFTSTLPSHRHNTITFQLWEWHKESNIYDLKHFTMLQKEGEWAVSERVSQYRAYKSVNWMN